MKNKFLTSRDYAKLFERAKRILDREISKPSDEWDEGLIEELEETMLYCAERKKVLLSEEKQSRRLQPSFKLRRALVIVVAVLASLAVFATIAQAAGLRVWSAIVHWDKDYLRVDYSGDQSHLPNEDVNESGVIEQGSESSGESFSTLDSLKSYLGAEIPYLEGYDEFFDSAFASKSDDIMYVKSKYKAPYGVITVEITVVSMGAPEQAAASVIHNDEFDDVYEKNIDGIDCIFGVKSKKTVCLFTKGNMIVNIWGDVTTEQIETLASKMMKGV